MHDRAVLIVQAIVALLLVLSLAFHVAEVGLIGLLVIILATSFTGITEEHRLGKAFEAALPFAALLVVFFVIVAEIHDQHLFEPLIAQVLALEGRLQAIALYCATGALSAISDNVFVASIYITEIKAALLKGDITREQFDLLAVAINTGTNIPSVATPEWPGRVPVPAHLDPRPADPARLRPHGVDGTAVFRRHDRGGAGGGGVAVVRTGGNGQGVGGSGAAATVTLRPAS